ncbi:hypothetical protein P4O66_008376, partial [Electrophorus voltai]
STSPTTYKNSTSVPTKPPNTTMGMTTSLTESSTVTSTSVTTEASDTDPDAYIEDSCVALLSFGMWWEKHCSDLLPYICYDEVFYGTVVVSNTTECGASVRWNEVTGNITHYRVHLSTQNSTPEMNEFAILNETETEFIDLKPGTLYHVQVFPVKCGRDLNPQNVSFYTLPKKISNLTIVKVETENVTLKWSAPYGGYNLYSVTVSGKATTTNNSEKYTVMNLDAGVLYNFSVCAVVNISIYGQPVSIVSYTSE